MRLWWTEIKPYLGIITITVLFFLWAFEFWVPFTIVIVVFFVWAFYVMSIEGDRRHQRFENWYANATIDQKIDHHLEVARRYDSNTDANIAQALIERKRNGS